MKFKFNSRFLALLAPVFLAISYLTSFQSQCLASDEASKCFLWKINGHGDASTVYLMGSLHMVPDGFYPLPDVIEKDFAGCKTYYLEADESKTNQADLQQMTIEKGMYPAGDTLSNHVGKDTKAELDKYLAKLGQAGAAFNQMKPWLAAITIDVLELQRLGFDPKLGLDKHFLEEAHQTKKEVGEMESTQAQLDLISGFSPELQDKFLLYTLIDLKTIEEDSAKMVQAWKAGDPETMDSLTTQALKEAPELLPVVEKLLYDRNVTMTSKIENLSKDKTSSFVVVGAAHLTGNKGILKLLQGKGFSVEQVTQKQQ